MSDFTRTQYLIHKRTWEHNKRLIIKKLWDVEFSPDYKNQEMMNFIRGMDRIRQIIEEYKNNLGLYPCSCGAC